jgi:hypothetical protein
MPLLPHAAFATCRFSPRTAILLVPPSRCRSRPNRWTIRFDRPPAPHCSYRRDADIEPPCPFSHKARSLAAQCRPLPNRKRRRPMRLGRQTSATAASRRQQGTERPQAARDNCEPKAWQSRAARSGGAAGSGRAAGPERAVLDRHAALAMTAEDGRDGANKGRPWPGIRQPFQPWAGRPSRPLGTHNRTRATFAKEERMASGRGRCRGFSSVGWWSR